MPRRCFFFYILTFAVLEKCTSTEVNVVVGHLNKGPFVFDKTINSIFANIYLPFLCVVINNLFQIETCALPVLIR